MGRGRLVPRSWNRFPKSLTILLIVLLQCAAIVSHLDLAMAAGRFQPNTKSELQRSMARYRHLLERDPAARTLQQVQENKIEEPVQEGKSKQPGEQEKQEDAVVQVVNEKKTEEAADNLNENLVVEESQKGEEHLNSEEPEPKNESEKSSEEQPHGDTNSESSEPQTNGLEEHLEEEREEQNSKSEPQNNGSEGHPEEHQQVEQNSKSSEPQANSEEHLEEQHSTSEPQNNGSEEHPEEQQREEQNSEESQKNVEENSEQQGPAEKNVEDVPTEQNSESSEQQQTKEPEPFVFPEPYLLGPTIKDWDEQRAGWLEQNPHMKLTPEGTPRVLIVTGSQPWPCQSPVGDNFHLKSLKIKMDYARLHNFEIYYNFVWLDPLFGGYWVKLPTIRNLMLRHPEIEWFFWVDSDAVFTDMMFEVPFHEFDGSDMVLWGWHEGFFKNKNWVAINAGVFFLRNSQWTLDLIDKWSPMGPDGPVRDEFGKVLTSYLSNRGDNYPADDQSALAYLILTDPAVLSRVKLVQDDYKISGYWVDHVSHYEEYMEKYHPGLGDFRWPFVTHFTGCSPCSGHNNPDYPYEMCMDNFNRAYNFADNQVLAFMGFQHKSLSDPEVVRTRNETTRPLEYLGVNPWAERIAQLAASSR